MLEPRVLVGKCVSKYYTLRVKFSLKLSLTNKQRLLWPLGSPRNILISTKIHDFFKNWAYISHLIRSNYALVRYWWDLFKRKTGKFQQFFLLKSTNITYIFRKLNVKKIESRPRKGIGQNSLPLQDIVVVLILIISEQKM